MNFFSWPFECMVNASVLCQNELNSAVEDEDVGDIESDLL